MRRHYLEEMLPLVDRIRAALCEGRFEDVGQALHEGWMLKRNMASRISDGEIDAIYERALRAGALGGKIAGAGGGGFLLLYVPPEHQEHVRAALTGMFELTFLPERDGSKVIFNFPPVSLEMSTDPRRSHIQDYLDTLKRVLDELPLDAVETVLRIFEDAYRRDATVYICGNGGSWATAGHWVCDMAKGTICEGRRRLRMISLGDNLPMLTAYANDVHYDQVFAEPVRTYARAGDVVVLLTASGNSPNILAAARAAESMRRDHRRSDRLRRRPTRRPCRSFDHRFLQRVWARGGPASGPRSHHQSPSAGLHRQSQQLRPRACGLSSPSS